MNRKFSLVVQLFLVITTIYALPAFSASVDLIFYNCSAHTINQQDPDDRYSPSTILRAPGSIEYYAKDAHWWRGPGWENVGSIGCRHFGYHRSVYSYNPFAHDATSSLDVHCGHHTSVGFMDSEYRAVPQHGRWADRAHVNQGDKIKLRLSKDSPTIKVHVGSNPASEYAVFVYTETGIGGVGPGDRDMWGNDLDEEYFVEHGLRYPRLEGPFPTPLGSRGPSSPIRPITHNFLVKPLDEVTDFDFQMCGSRGWLGYLIF